MRVRALRGFVIGPGQEVRKGEVFELDQRVVRHGGVSVYVGLAIPRSYYEVLPTTSEPPPDPVVETESRDAESLNRDPNVQNRDPRPQRRRAAKGDS